MNELIYGKGIEELTIKYGYIEWKNGACEYLDGRYIYMSEIRDIKAIKVNKKQFEVKILDDIGMVKIAPIY